MKSLNLVFLKLCLLQLTFANEYYGNLEINSYGEFDYQSGFYQIFEAENSGNLNEFRLAIFRSDIPAHTLSVFFYESDEFGNIHSSLLDTVLSKRTEVPEIASSNISDWMFDWRGDELDLYLEKGKFYLFEIHEGQPEETFTPEDYEHHSIAYSNLPSGNNFVLSRYSETINVGFAYSFEKVITNVESKENIEIVPDVNEEVSEELNENTQNSSSTQNIITNESGISAGGGGGGCLLKKNFLFNLHI